MAELHRLLEDAGCKSVVIKSQHNGHKVNLISPLEVLGDIGEISTFYNYRLVFKLEGFRITISVQSLPVAGYPNIYPEDSVTARNNKILQAEYHNPRFMLRLYKQQNGVLYELGNSVLQNKGMQTQKSLMTPFLTDGSVKLLSKEDVLLGEIVNCGYGLFAYNDFVQIELDYSWHISGFRKEIIRIKPDNFGKIINSITPQLLIPSNPYRARLHILNSGENDVSVAFGKQSDCVVGNCPVIKPGASWNDENKYLFTDSVWAISHSESSLITGIEGTYI